MLDVSAKNKITNLAPLLRDMSDLQISNLVNTGTILNDLSLYVGREGSLASFYAPFDWVNEKADIVLVGITPGKQQAEAALKSLKDALARGESIESAAASVKAEASFKGDMREISAKLMDHFGFPKLLALSRSSDLFGTASNRVHYTSVFRYPVLDFKNGVWSNFSGTGWHKSAMLRSMVDNLLSAELKSLRNAWIIPFGPTPLAVLNSLIELGSISADRVLGGLNHPSGQQWNRHNCQLDLVDHDRCGKNVGCTGNRARSASLREKVQHLALRGVV